MTVLTAGEVEDRAAVGGDARSADLDGPWKNMERHRSGQECLILLLDGVGFF